MKKTAIIAGSENLGTTKLAEKLDESLEIVTGLWTGKQFSYTGKHYRLQSSVLIPPPKQTPRIPIYRLQASGHTKHPSDTQPSGMA